METYWYHNKIVLLGPYVGSFSYELYHFKPFVDWVINNLKVENVIVSTHFNRSFLYNNTIPIFKQYSKDQNNQYKHRHRKINSKDYQFLINDIKDQIISISDFNKNDIVMYNLGYVSYPNIYYCQKYIQKLYNRNYTNNKIIYIPHNSRPKFEHDKVFKNFKDDVTVLGDNKIHLQNYNWLFHEKNYHYKVYETILKELMQCKAVITPYSHWTYFCNLHNIPVFSWGDPKLSNYYYLKNNKFRGVPFKKKNNINILIRAIKNFLEEIQKWN